MHADVVASWYHHQVSLSLQAVSGWIHRPDSLAAASANMLGQLPGSKASVNICCRGPADCQPLELLRLNS
ncbi:hypothetical protein [Sandarakinorhabdus sp.]|uniref:hypothetical protein n=1 Tax=Sandarakinorhabdus sp. TaxID=1916663 RepID=UPI003F6F1090